MDHPVIMEEPERAIKPLLTPPLPSKARTLATFGMEIVLDRRIAPGKSKRFEFVEKAERPLEEEPGLKEFLQDPSLNCDAAREEIEFLKKLRFKQRPPTALYYYRELQNLRDPLHFRAALPTTR